MANAKLVGTGRCSPSIHLTNEELSKLLGQPIKPSLEERVGIKARYICSDEESSADLGEKAALEALEDAGMKPEELDLIIVATDTPEYLSPSTAVVIQGRIKAVNAGVFDLNSSCAGFPTAVDIASAMIARGDYKNIMVIGVYAMTKYIAKDDAGLLPIFADGAGAIILSATDEDCGFLSSQLIADGTQYDFMGIYAGGTKMPMTVERIQKGEHRLLSLKPLPGDRNVKLWPPLLEKVTSKAGITIQDVDHFFFTQINRSVIVEVMNIIGQPLEKATCIMDEYGYTGSACIPMALDVARKKGVVKPGDIIIMTASGVGFAVASVAFKL